jgi:hypothetical protein
MTLIQQPHGEVVPAMPPYAIDELVHPTSVPFVSVAPAASNPAEAQPVVDHAVETDAALSAADLRAVEVLRAALRVRPEGRPAAYTYADQTSVTVGVNAAQLAAADVWNRGA